MEPAREYEREYLLAARRSRWTRQMKAGVAYFVLVIFAIIAIGPFLYLLALLRRASISSPTPPQWLPESPHGQLRDGHQRHELSALGLNTLIYAGAVTIISVFIDALAGYAFARLRFPGGTLRRRALDADDPDGGGDCAPLPDQGVRHGQHVSGADPATVVSPLRHDASVHQHAARGLYEAARLDGANEFQVPTRSCCL